MFGSERKALEAELAETRANLNIAMAELAVNGWTFGRSRGPNPENEGTLLLRYEYNEKPDSLLAKLKKDAAEAGRIEGRRELAKLLGYSEYPGGVGGLIFDLELVRKDRQAAQDAQAADARLRSWEIKA